MQMKALALDFDGVISDSVAESFVVALRTLGELRPETGFTGEADSLFEGGREAVLSHPHYAGFLELMPLGNRAEDFAVLLLIVSAGGCELEQADYDREREALDPGFLTSFHRLFYEQREMLSERDRAAWLGLLGPYHDFVRVMRRNSTRVALALATAKDSRSVGILLEHYGIDDLFGPERILDKETGPDKRAHLRVLSERLDLAPEEITFIDDKLNHLESVSQLGVRCGLAAWGYNGERERRRARELGHLVCELERIEEQLFSPDAPRA
jgi:phosphoglycolate phosphatase-like HAD superfamily hydrolase